MGTQELSVSWKDHSNVLIAVFEKLLSNRSLVDCTVAAEGHYLRVHKVVLSACSPYFEVLLNEDTDKHPIIILRDVKFNTLKRIIDFAYRGEVKLPEDQLVEFLNVAESLQIKGLDGRSNDVSGKRLSADDILNSEPDSQISHKRLRNEYCRSKNIADEPTPSTESSTSEQPWCPPSIESVPSDFNGSSSMIYNACVQNNFSSSENKSNKGNSILIPVHPCSKTIVKQEFVEIDCFIPKEELPNEILEEEITKDSFELDPEDQSVQPGTSQQYSELPSTDTSSTNTVGHCALTGAKEPERSGRKGYAAPSDEAILPDIPSQTGGVQQVFPNQSSTVHPVTQVRPVESLNGKLVCNICQCIFSEKIDFQQHLVTHKVIKRYQCEVCSRKFRQLSQLNRHMRTHTGEKPYKCEVCKKMFREVGNLKEHMRVHTGEKPFVCDVCNRRFRRSTQLKVHKRIHTGEKPYECEVCGAAFSQVGNLRTHVRLHAR